MSELSRRKKLITTIGRLDGGVDPQSLYREPDVEILYEYGHNLRVELAKLEERGLLESEGSPPLIHYEISREARIQFSHQGLDAVLSRVDNQIQSMNYQRRTTRKTGKETPRLPSNTWSKRERQARS